jgi:flagellar hook assembly protein FlgD
MGNYPNPFNPSTQISYTLASPGHTTLSIYDTLGRLVTTLVDGMQTMGQYTLSWNGLDNQDQPVPGGVYFYRLTSGSCMATGKMTLMK